ncbi:SPRY domain-containing protein [Ditylenchus destructor]|uniref:SPRY domain-containing protein n=1 Tax=Ditylenchus destructor TaxID=166010 RepID=A0AAD4MYL1_9BILA|nr:SPRY domain-containing protein [Ditylenchus destructor]
MLDLAPMEDDVISSARIPSIPISPGDPFLSIQPQDSEAVPERISIENFGNFQPTIQDIAESFQDPPETPEAQTWTLPQAEVLFSGTNFLTNSFKIPTHLPKSSFPGQIPGMCHYSGTNHNDSMASLTSMDFEDPQFHEETGDESRDSLDPPAAVVRLVNLKRKKARVQSSNVVKSAELLKDLRASRSGPSSHLPGFACLTCSKGSSNFTVTNCHHLNFNRYFADSAPQGIVPGKSIDEGFADMEGDSSGMEWSSPIFSAVEVGEQVKQALKRRQSDNYSPELAVRLSKLSHTMREDVEKWCFSNNDLSERSATSAIPSSAIPWPIVSNPGPTRIPGPHTAPPLPQSNPPQSQTNPIYQEEDRQEEYRRLHRDLERIAGCQKLTPTKVSQSQHNGILSAGQPSRRQRRVLSSSTSTNAAANYLPLDSSGASIEERHSVLEPLAGEVGPQASASRRSNIQINIARGLIDLARGHHSSNLSGSSSRAIHRRSAKLQAGNSATISAHQSGTNRGPQAESANSSTAQRAISPAHPLNIAHALVDEASMQPYKFDVVLGMPLPSREEMERHAWNPDDRSLNIYVKDEDRLTLHRHPVAQSTDCIRGKVGYTRGFHVWQLVWPMSQRGTHPVVGVATKECPLHATGYNALIGSNTDSYGWDIVQNKCYHDSRNTKGWSYPNYPSSSVDDTFQAPDKFYCILDMDEGYMAFATSKQYLGVAFRGLKGKKVHPIVSAVWGHAEITIRYMGGLDPEPRQLMDVCRRTIRLQLGRERLDRIEELKLPPTLMNYLLYQS